jgi:hypothetical protein
VTNEDLTGPTSFEWLRMYRELHCQPTIFGHRACIEGQYCST